MRGLNRNDPDEAKTDFTQNRKDANRARDSGLKVGSPFGVRFSDGNPSASSLASAAPGITRTVVSRSCGLVSRLGFPDSARHAVAFHVWGMESRLQPVWVFNDGPSREFQGV